MRAAAARAEDNTGLQPKSGPRSEELPIFGRR
jgi:hypothetical protein